MAWTSEPAYADPGPELLDAAGRWRSAVDVGRLRQLVGDLPGPRSRLHAPEAMAAADASIVSAWRGGGWTVDRQELRLRNVHGLLEAPRGDVAGPLRKVPHTFAHLEGANLVATLPGEVSEAIVLVAHHDTVLDSPGADDNGAAVAGLVELAHVLAGRRFHRTVVLAAVDFEELDLIGSRYLVPWLNQRYRVRAAIVFDAIGYMDRAPNTQSVPPGLARLYPGQAARLRNRKYAGDMLVSVYRDASRQLAQVWARCLAATIGRDRVLQLRDPADLPIVGRLAARALPVVRNFSRSDHVNFWRAGLPAIQVSNTGNFRNPNYHQRTDTPETLDYETLAGIVAGMAMVIERVAGQPAVTVG